MKDEEKAGDHSLGSQGPKASGYPQCHSREPGRVSPPGLSYALLRLPPGTEGACPWLGRGGICLSPDRAENKPACPGHGEALSRPSSGWDLIKANHVRKGQRSISGVVGILDL